jgi:fused signal recognition particle receptor
MSEGPGFFSRLKKGLSRSANSLAGGISDLFNKRKLDEAALAELEDLLIAADLGPAVAARVTAGLAKDKFDKEISDAEVRQALADVVAEILGPLAQPLRIEARNGPHVILVVGVNGTGKTTTIGKIAGQLTAAGKTVVLGAADTFRAAAIEQLEIWGERANATVVRRDVGADPAAVAFETMQRAREEGADVVIIDTAGRLQNKAGLMDELAKIVRVIAKQDETAPHDTLLVLDATTGQNALNQIEVFADVCNVSGLAMTKLDGTARGGVLVAAADKFALPVHFIGLGEGIEDLQPFNAADFSRVLAGLAD